MRSRNIGVVAPVLLAVSSFSITIATVDDRSGLESRQEEIHSPIDCAEASVEASAFATLESESQVEAIEDVHDSEEFEEDTHPPDR